jgi:glycerophosphoryl diester phosphodiesterase
VTRVFAHRGSVGAHGENTLGAFTAALEAGADGVELDVRRSRDGALVVHHDVTIEGVGAICDLRVRDLPRNVALLADAMEVLDPLVVNVEIKNDPDEPGHDPSGSISHDVVALLDELGDLDRVVVSSFDLPTLDAVRQASASVTVGWLLSYEVASRTAVEGAVAHGFQALHPWVLTVEAADVDAAHGAGIELATWTVNARHDLERMVRLGVDTVITDDVGVALDVVAGLREAPNGVAGPASA